MFNIINVFNVIVMSWMWINVRVINNCIQIGFYQLIIVITYFKLNGEDSNKVEAGKEDKEITNQGALPSQFQQLVPSPYKRGWHPLLKL